jgi:oligopeptide/dipeptide ABC transporter ATP-binding protein
MNLLVRLQDELTLAYVFISHDLGMVRHISDEIEVMYLGRVVERGPWEEVLDRPLHPYTRALAAAVPVADPDLAQRNRAEAIGDQPVVQAEVEQGCPYRPRCPLAEEVCERVDPPLLELAPSHEAACHVAARAAQEGRPEPAPGPRATG